MKWSMTNGVEDWGPRVADRVNDMRSAGREMLNNAEQMHGRPSGMPRDARTVWIQVNANTTVPVAVPAKARRAYSAQPAALGPSAGPNVQPEPIFRQELHRALEETHRQQMAQRSLGTHTPVDWREAAQAQEAQTRAWSTSLIVMGLALLWLLVGRRRIGQD